MSDTVGESSMGLTTFDINGLQIRLVDEGDRNALHERDQGYERASLRLWSRLVVPGKVALDVGAYTGIYSIVAAMMGARVIALEPMPAQYWRLTVNAKANRAAFDIQTLMVAASDRHGTADLHYNPKVSLTTGASLEAGQALHRASLPVTTIPIDSLALGHVGVIKIDTEGHEPCVIRGAMETIRLHRPPLLVETLNAGMRSIVLALLPNYRTEAIVDGRNTLFTPK